MFYCNVPVMMNEFGCIPNEPPNLSLICLSLAQSNQTIKDKVLAFEDRVAPIDEKMRKSQFG